MCLWLAGCGPVSSTPDPGSDDGSDAGSTSDTGDVLLSSGTDGATDPVGDSSSGAPTTTGEIDDTGDGTAGSDETGRPPAADLCVEGGDFAFALEASGLERHEGRAVTIVVMEPTGDPGLADDPVVQLHPEVVDGSFAGGCPSALSMAANYPSWAVVIDADDDGQCSDGDLAFSLQLFGWATDQIYTIDGDTVLSHDSRPPWEITQDAWLPVSSIGEVWGTTFCDYYAP